MDDEREYLPPTGSYRTPSTERRPSYLDSLKAMISSLLSHFYVADEAPETRTLLAADWLAALQTKPMPAIAEARRRWIQERDRRPKVAEFLALVEECRASGGYNPEGGRVLLEHPIDPQTGEKVGYNKLTDAERWSYHARLRAWRKKMGLPQSPDGSTPMDPSARYVDRNLDRIAEHELNTAGKRDYEPPRPAPSHVVRPDWKRIRRADLTAAELALSDAERERIKNRAGVDVDAPPVRRMAAE